MGNRLLMVMVTAVAIVAVGGIGFAAFTSTITANISSTAGTISLVWGGFTYNAYHEDGTPATYVSCSATAGGAGYASVSISVTNLAPGDYCVIQSNIIDAGNIPGTVTQTLYNGVSTPCYDLYPATCFFEDDTFHNQGDLSGSAASVSGLPTPVVDNEVFDISPGGGLPSGFVAVVQLSPGAVNAEQGLTDTLEEQFTATSV
jgi:hypothetical protein